MIRGSVGHMKVGYPKYFLILIVVADSAFVRRCFFEFQRVSVASSTPRTRTCPRGPRRDERVSKSAGFSFLLVAQSGGGVHARSAPRRWVRGEDGDKENGNEHNRIYTGRGEENAHENGIEKFGQRQGE